MNLYSSNEYYKLYQGNMLDMLEVIEPNTIDAVITDPPYELNFMNKGWDNSGIAFQKETWQKCYEVLKPGGYLLAFGGSRTFHRIACAIEDAGFEIRDTIMWLYGSGFPKSMDISKQIDKRGGNDYSKQFAIDLKQARESRNLTMKYCDDKYCNGSTNWSWYEGRKDGCRVPDYQTYLEIIKEFPELEKYKELIKEAEREVIGTKKNIGCFNNDKHYTVGGTKANDIDITIPNTDLAKQWQGWGTALKPSFEPIIVARKPFKGSLVDNVIEYGVGGINIDECRIETIDKVKMNIRDTSSSSDGWNRPWMEDKEKDKLRQEIAIEKANNLGRFPANTILTYDENDFDEVCGGFPNTKSNYEKPNANHTFKGNKDAFTYGYKMRYGSGYEDSGSAARYFMNCKYTEKDEDFRRYIYTPKASKKDRDEGLDSLEIKKTGELQGGRKEGSAGSIMLNADGTTRVNPYAGIGTPKRNNHPTVKPTELMQYLIRLVSPNGATILDPFNGSGSTGKAVMYENKERNKNYKYIGIELTEEYLPISKARIEHLIDIPKEEKQDENIPTGQTSIYDFIDSVLISLNGRSDE